MDRDDFENYIGEDYQTFISEFFEYTKSNPDDYKTDSLNMWINSHNWTSLKDGYGEYYFKRLNAGYKFPSDKNKDTSKFNKINMVSLHNDGRLKIYKN